jgi:hypothetical protein
MSSFSFQLLPARIIPVAIVQRYVEGTETQRSQPRSKPAAVVAMLPRREENVI